MVVNIFIHIESSEDIKRVTEVYLPRNDCIISKDWEKVCGTDNGVDVDDRHDPILVAVDIGLDYPHAIVGVRVFEGFAKLMDECARKVLISDVERKEEMDPGNI